MLLSPSSARPLIHGHRGCRGLRPENTLPAFLHAIRLGVDVLEMDVVVSADGQVVVSHEPWPSALLCSTPDGHPIRPEEELSHNFYALPYTAIRSFDCGQRPHPDFPEQLPMPAYKPLLADVIQAADNYASQLGRSALGFSVEIKTELNGDGLYQPTPLQFVELVLDVLQSARVQARTTLLSFDERILIAARSENPDLRLCLLVETPFTVAGLFQGLGFVPDVFGPAFHLLSTPLVQELRTKYPYLELVPWTVNELADMHRLMDWGIAGITTDYPDRLLALLRTGSK